MFPLQSVFFPEEMVPLHIFEERYKNLVRDCKEGAHGFGIPVYINNTLRYGTEMQLLEIVEIYPNGELDIVCRAGRVFEVKTFQEELPGFLYAGGTVDFLGYEADGTRSLQQQILEAVKELYKLMEIPWDHVFGANFGFNQWIHKIGLNLQQEYELLQMRSESQRQKYILRHLAQTAEVLKQLAKMKDVIELNGHFKNFDPLHFKDFKI